MKVDMSPKAVTERLRTLNELWVLSIKLMNAKKVKPKKDIKYGLSDNSGNSHFASTQD